MQIKLKVTDKHHLEIFKSDIQYTGKIKEVSSIREGKEHLGALLYISSKEIIQDLKKIYNISQKKSLILKPPFLEESEKDLFIKGYFDGDGTIYQKGAYLCVRFYGTQEINVWIKNRIDSLYGKNSGSLFKKGSIWCFELNPGASIFFGKHFSEIKSPSLERKWNKFK